MSKVPELNKFHVGNGDDGKHYWLTPADQDTVKHYKAHVKALQDALVSKIEKEPFAFCKVEDVFEATGVELKMCEQKWIPVSERLPEHDSVVIVAGWAYNKPNGERYTLIARFYNDGTFANEETGDDLYPPTHWQPLPAQPPQNAADHIEAQSVRNSIRLNEIARLCASYLNSSGDAWVCGANDMAVKVLALIGQPDAQSVRDSEYSALLSLQSTVEDAVRNGVLDISIETALAVVQTAQSAPPQKPVSEDL